jgi:hypothetical protein
MARLAVLGGLIAVAIALLLFMPSSQKEGDLVLIEPLALRGVDGIDLETAYLLAVAPANAYPSVVATVNGVPIAGEALAIEQARLELSRRQLASDDAFPQDVIDQQLEEIARTDPLESLIDNELLRQAAERRGLYPSYEDGVASVDKLQAMFGALALEEPHNLSPYDRKKWDDLVDAFVSGQWSADPARVERIRESQAIAQLPTAACTDVRPTPPSLSAQFTKDCAALLRQERLTQDIIYLVKWR